jgi:hypothetical protein
LCGSTLHPFWPLASKRVLRLARWHGTCRCCDPPPKALGYRLSGGSIRSSRSARLPDPAAAAPAACCSGCSAGCASRGRDTVIGLMGKAPDALPAPADRNAEVGDGSCVFSRRRCRGGDACAPPVPPPSAPLSSHAAPVLKEAAEGELSPPPGPPACAAAPAAAHAPPIWPCALGVATPARAAPTAESTAPVCAASAVNPASPPPSPPGRADALPASLPRARSLGRCRCWDGMLRPLPPTAALSAGSVPGRSVAARGAETAANRPPGPPAMFTAMGMRSSGCSEAEAPPPRYTTPRGSAEAAAGAMAPRPAVPGIVAPAAAPELAGPEPVLSHGRPAGPLPAPLKSSALKPAGGAGCASPGPDRLPEREGRPSTSRPDPTRRGTPAAAAAAAAAAPGAAPTPPGRSLPVACAFGAAPEPACGTSDGSEGASNRPAKPPPGGARGACAEAERSSGPGTPGDSAEAACAAAAGPPLALHAAPDGATGVGSAGKPSAPPAVPQPPG